MPSPAAPLTPPSPNSVSSREWIVLAVALLIGAALRCAWPSRADVEHFDEGVYAANEYSAETDFQYPRRELYAPPLFPAMAGWAITFAKDPAAAVWVSILGGILTIPLVWWTARSWFGPVAGGVVVLLAATSEYHIWLSRAALTDVWLCLWMTAGVYTGWRGLLSGRPLWLFGAGAFAALAWWTKYNGWLTLAVIGGGWLVAFVVATFRKRDAGLVVPIPSALLRWTGIALAAVALWSPVWKGLAPVGGYAAVAKNHAGYFVGLGGWLTSLIQQIAAQQTALGWTTLLGAALAFGSAAVLSRAGLSRTVLLGLVWFSLTFFGTNAVGALGVAAILLIAWDRDPFLQGLDEDDRYDRWLGWGMAAAWLGGLSLAVPLYRPYPRLSLPWLVGTWFALGTGVPWILAAIDPVRRKRRDRVAAGLLVVAFFLPVIRQMTGPGQPGLAWEDRTGMREAAHQLQATLVDHVKMVPPTRIAEVGAIVYVVGEPALFCHLSAQEPVSPVRYFTRADASLGMLVPGPGQADVRVPTYVVLGGRAARAMRSDLDRFANLLVRVPLPPARQSRLVALDEFPAWTLDGRPEQTTNEIECYYVKADR